MMNNFDENTNAENENGETRDEATGFDIQEPDDLTGIENRATAPDGFIKDLNSIIQVMEDLKRMSAKDLEVLERVMKIYRGKNTENLKNFIVRCTGWMFVFWTVLLPLLVFLMSAPLSLLSESVPATLFGVAVHHYFKDSKDGT